MIVNKTQLTNIFGVTLRTIQNWQNEGLPSLTEGQQGTPNQYNTGDCIKWYVEREIDRRFKRSGDDKLDSDAELARLRHHQADKTEMEAALLKGTLLRADEVMTNLVEQDRKVASAILALPTRLAQVAIATDDIKEIEKACHEEVERALLNLSSFTADEIRH